MKEILKKVLIVLVVLFLTIGEIIIGTYDLIKLKNADDEKIIWATELTTVEHSMGGLIPLGKEYYYVGITDDMKMVLFKGKKNLLKKNFDSEGYSISEYGYSIKDVKETTTTTAYSEAGRFFDQVSESELGSVITGYDMGHCYNAEYKTSSIYKIVFGVFSIFAVAICYVIYKVKDIEAMEGKEKVLILVFVAVVLIEAYLSTRIML